MQGNWTDVGEGSHWGPESITTLVTGVGGCVASLLTFAYFKFKQQFRDQQKTDIQLKHKINKDGSTEISVNIQLLNDEKYMLEHKTASKTQGDSKDPASNDQLSPVPIPNQELALGSLQTVVDNNNKGDQIIGQTRNHIGRDALNTALKFLQLHYQKIDESPLDVPTLQSPAQPMPSKEIHTHPTPLHLHNHNRMVPLPLDSIKRVTSLEEESKEVSPNAYSVALVGAAATGDGSFTLSAGETVTLE